MIAGQFRYLLERAKLPYLGPLLEAFSLKKIIFLLLVRFRPG